MDAEQYLPAPGHLPIDREAAELARDPEFAGAADSELGVAVGYSRHVQWAVAYFSAVDYPAENECGDERGA